jgi:hypothetical protein
MAQVQLSDVYVPLDYATGAQQSQIERNVFIQSGIVTGDPRISAFASVGGAINEVAFMNPLGTPEPNYSNDDPNDESTANKITGGKFQVRTAFQNQSWSTMDFAVELALIKPMPAITGRIGAYWATTNERRVIASSAGVLADNVSNDSSDMLHSIAITTGTIDDSNRVNSNAIIDTIQTMGDHGEMLKVMAMHSAVYRKMQKDQLIDFVPASDGQIDIPMYQGKRVLVDDSLTPDLTVPAYPVYTIHFFTAGAYVGGEGMPENASELWRDPKAGNGSGQSTLFSRRTDIQHPLGFSCVGTPAGETLTLAELRLAATWDRVWDRKVTGLAFLQVNV